MSACSASGVSAARRQRQNPSTLCAHELECRRGLLRRTRHGWKDHQRLLTQMLASCVQLGGHLDENQEGRLVCSRRAAGCIRKFTPPAPAKNTFSRPFEISFSRALRISAASCLLRPECRGDAPHQSSALCVAPFFCRTALSNMSDNSSSRSGKRKSCSIDGRILATNEKLATVKPSDGGCLTARSKEKSTVYYEASP